MSVVKALELKRELAFKIKGMLEGGEIEKALNDHHACRFPRPCGLTIHPGVGCDFGCVYCYISDMGFPLKPRPYPLSGIQLAYSILQNPSVAPGLNGTLFAFGSVTEPFAKPIFKRTLEYLRSVKEFLGNPSQISTKAYLKQGDVILVKESADEYLSVLVTIVAWSSSKKLEPNAPSPEKRLEVLKNFAKMGFHTSLFLRPLIPNIPESEIRTILEKSANMGVHGVIIGSLRVTDGIIKRLELARINTSNIKSRIRVPLSGRRQVNVPSRDIKERVRKLAEELGFKVYPAACSANIDAHGQWCHICDWGPCGDEFRIPEVDELDIKEYLHEFKIPVYKVEMSGENNLIIYVKSKSKYREHENFISSIVRRRVHFKKV